MPLWHSGELAEQDFFSPLSVDIEPKEAPKSVRDDLSKKIAPIFDYDDTVLEIWLQNWQLTFQKIRQEFYIVAKAQPKNPGLLDVLGQRIQEQTGQSVLARDLIFLHQNRFSPEAEVVFTELAKNLLGKLIAQSDLFPSYYSTGIVVRQVNQALNETLIYDVSRIWSVEHAREFISHVLTSAPAGKSEIHARIAAMVNYLIVPNVKFNAALTQKRISAAMGMKRATLYSLKKGQLLIRRGERVNDQQVEILQNLSYLTSARAAMKRFTLIFLVLFVFFSVLFRMELTRKSLWRLSLKDSLFFAGVAWTNLFCVKYALPYVKIGFHALHLTQGVEYLMPISAGGIIIHLMMGKEAAMTYAMVLSASLAFLLDLNFPYSIWAFAVTASAVQSIRSCKQRTDLYKSGAWSGCVGALLVLAFALLQTLGFQTLNWSEIGAGVGMAFFSGMLAAGITSSLIPILEAVFGYTTSLKLLELSNFNHPLLHDLMMKAPGTYHHSIIVGSLAEIAADRVKANALLARVSAYYHDIGKMGKPLYFIENQAPNQNPHDHLTPAMSAKILFSHVKNGVRLGQEHNLGNAINGIIEQHHGTTLVSYFFNKAKKSEKAELDPVNENDFRYPGPRPQTREAAIVMIADACEAATRSIADPTPAKIQSMVRNIINKRFLEQQFNECDLTLSDLQIIEESFTRTLVSLYHHRIEYPGQKQEITIDPFATSAPTPTPAKRSQGV